MDDERWNHVDQLLQSALDLPEAERDVFLGNACGGNEQLEGEVRSLLAAHDRANSFLAAPAIDLAARQLAGQPGDDTIEALSGDRQQSRALAEHLAREFPEDTFVQFIRAEYARLP